MRVFVCQNNVLFVSYSLLDPRKDRIRLLLEADSQKVSQYVRGYRIINYKEFLFVVGGQQELGLREFVKNVWVYDIFKEKWERSTLWANRISCNSPLNCPFAGCPSSVVTLKCAFQAIICLLSAEVVNTLPFKTTFFGTIANQVRIIHKTT